MPRGRPPKPLERRELLAKGDGLGTSHGGKKKELAVITGEIVADGASCEVEPPFGLEGRGLVEWEKIWTAGKSWLHPNEDYHWVEQISHAYNDMEEFRRQIAIQGLTVKGYAGQVAANPLIKEVRECERTIRSCLSAIGFSPTDRARLGLAEIAAQNGLQKLQNKTRKNEGSR